MNLRNVEVGHETRLPRRRRSRYSTTRRPRRLRTAWSAVGGRGAVAAVFWEVLFQGQMCVKSLVKAKRRVLVYACGCCFRETRNEGEDEGYQARS